MFKIIFIGVVSTFLTIVAYAQKGFRTFSKDTTVVGVVLESDSIFQILNDNRFGAHYYYGVHHLKIGLVDVSDSLVKDTAIIAYVYNMRSELNSYFKNFNLKDNHCYIFDLGKFSPCKADFPRLEGRCKFTEFFPLSNKLIKRYSSIYRVINIAPWMGNIRKG
jgi:hypothetical protein